MPESPSPPSPAFTAIRSRACRPEPLAEVALRAGQTLPADRRYAIENGPSGFDAADPQYFPKIKFLMLMRNERLAALRTRYDDHSHVLTIRRDGTEAARGDLQTAEGRAAIEAFFADQFRRGTARPAESPVRRRPQFFRRRQKGGLDHQPRQRRRARGDDRAAGPSAALPRQSHRAGWPAWHEFALLDQTLAIGEARLKVVKRIVRCAATNVDPDTAARDLNIPQTLMRSYGHADCGVYAEVIAGGDIAVGDAIVVAAA